MRGRHRVTAAGPLALVLALACRPDDGGEGSASGEAMSTGDAVEVPDPAFLNPAVGEFSVDSTRHVPEDIVVQRVVLGNTQVLLDGQSLGPLGPGNLLGELTADRLRLFVRGALTVGFHTLQLASSAADGPRFSVTLTMAVERPDAPLPAFRAELAPDLLGPGDRLLSAGAGPRALLGVVVAGPTPGLRLHLAEGTSWSQAGVTVALPGHVLEPMTFGPAVAALALPAADGPPTTVRVAWRRGLPGDAILTRDVALAAPQAGTPETALDLSAALFADAEYAEIGRPILAGSVALAEFVAPADTESALPGDRGLALARRGDAGWSAPQRVATPVPLDLDATGPALSLIDLAEDPLRLSVRVGRTLPSILEVSPVGAPHLSPPLGERPVLSGDPAVLATLESDFGSRTVIAAVRDRRPVLYFLGTSGQIEPVAAEPAPDTLPDRPLSAPPAVAVVRGYSAFLLPYGDDTPVHVLVGDGRDAAALALEAPEPLYCRAVALLPTLAGNDDGGAVPLACLGAAGLRLGVLTADPAPPP